MITLRGFDRPSLRLKRGDNGMLEKGRATEIEDTLQAIGK